MKEIHGDLIKLAIQGEFDVIVHGCNCQCVMGAGIAKQIKITIPEAYNADLNTMKGDSTKLGNYSSAVVHFGEHELTVINAYTQFNWRGNGVKVDYSAIKSIFEKIASEFDGKKIGYPLIGAGLAGGDWNVISEIIDEALTGQDHTLVKFSSD
ncbi:macro domain-containing protein [Vibrio rhizosphaerae]|uniref:Macro domain-containing protein n=1 Tax=Vibrio rhizosphaerae TaxID=398736 RepID=A0ABU4IV85_9VIBR|nr:macro domain-containing protein [Vibrio rhizosphaerae]MDW6093012.1 macro domain-containing protein [Vibrio rhizosphaerae]